MKRKIVIWGNDEKDNKILVALELKAEENKINIHTFAEEIATEAFYKQMIDEWRLGKEVAFPEGFKTIERPLSMTDDILPENIKVQRSDLINRAKTEWHFSVLSSKLYDLYKSELEEIKDRIDRLVAFDSGIWEELKTFWTKLSEQSRERNLFRDHAEKLKEQSNDLFNNLKELRTKATKELDKVSKERTAVIMAKLDEVHVKVEKGLGLSPIFEELKKIQSEFKSQEFARNDKNKLWKRIDEAFKVVKEKKYGKQKPEDGDGRMSRLERRYQGLMDAVNKMERSIARDRKDIEFQNRRVGETDGQLEMQIRQAKVKMVEGRMSSKQEKLDEMLVTKADLEQRLKKEAEHKAKLAEKKIVAAKKEEIKEKIAKEISDKASQVDSDKLKAAADSVQKGKTKKKESLLGAIVDAAEDALENVVDTVKAVAEVVTDKIEDKVEDLKLKDKVDSVKSSMADAADAMANKGADVKEAIADKVDDIKEEVAGDSGAAVKKGGLIAAAAAMGGALIKEISDKVEDIKDDVVEKVSEVKEAVSEKVEDAKETVSEKTEDIKEAISEKAEDVKETVSEKTEDVKEAVSEKAEEDVKEEGILKKGGFLAAAAAAGGALIKEIGDKVDDIKEEVSEKIEDVKEGLGGFTADETVDEVASRIANEDDDKGASEEE